MKEMNITKEKQELSKGNFRSNGFYTLLPPVFLFYPISIPNSSFINQTMNNIKTALITFHDSLDILDSIIFSSIIFNLGRLYQLFLNSKQS